MDLNLSIFRNPFSGSGSRRKQGTKSSSKVGYLIYGLAVAVIVFCGNYFSDRIEPMIRAELENQKAVQIQVRTIRPSLFPPRIYLEQIRIRDAKGRKELFQAGTADLSLDFKSLIKLSLGFDFAIHAYGADAVGIVGTGMFFNPSNIKLNIDCSSIELSRIPALRDMNLGLKGVGGFNFSVEGNPNQIKTLEGEFTAALENISFKGARPLFVVSTVPADNAAMRAVIGDGIVEIKQLALNGKDLSGNMEGKITLDGQNIMNSKLDLKGQMKADLKLFNQRAIVQKKAIALMKAKKAIPVEITDTIGAPWVALVN